MTKDAIEQRRSIRRFKSTLSPDEHVHALIDAARLAPSGSNMQPWRFKLVTDAETRRKLAAIAYQQWFIAEAPLVLVCCADLQSARELALSRSEDLERKAATEGRAAGILKDRADQLRRINVKELAPSAALNVAIAVEHIVLRALDYGLGTCWVRLFNEQKVRRLFGWDEYMHVVALLPVGYPAEAPAPRPRHVLEELILE